MRVGLDLQEKTSKREQKKESRTKSALPASGLRGSGLPIGPKVVPFWGSYSEFYKVIPKRNYFRAYGFRV